MINNNKQSIFFIIRSSDDNIQENYEPETKIKDSL